MKKFFVFALFGALLAMMPEMALANTTEGGVGGDLFADIQRMMSGNLGTIVGLVLALFGLYTWLVQQASWGLMMIIGGVALTAFPGIFDSLQTGFDNAFKDADFDKATVGK